MKIAYKLENKMTTETEYLLCSMDGKHPVDANDFHIENHYTFIPRCNLETPSNGCEEIYNLNLIFR